MTISLTAPKGVIDPPTAGDRRAIWWLLNGAIVVLSLGAFAVSGFHYAAWRRVGVDPPKGPVFARYEPPEGISPAGVHHIFYRTLHGHDALIASLVNLGVKKLIKIDVLSKKKTKLTRLGDDDAVASAFPAERKLLHKLLSHGESKTIGGKPDTAFSSAYNSFRKIVSNKFGADYFRWNAAYIIMAAVMSIIVIIIAANITAQWTGAHWIGVGVLVAVNLVFWYLLPAPTELGQETRTAIEGFRLYLEKAETMQLNAGEAGAAPPAMTVERYERFLPYAIALGVEKPWTKHFEKSLPVEAKSYNPYWTSGHRHSYRSLGAMNAAMVSSMASGVSSAMPQSSGASGSGGGFSGGGGGGGGGGGW